MPPVTLNFWSLINGTMLEAGSLEIVGVEKEVHIASISSLDRLLLSPLPPPHPSLPIKVKCSRFGKQPCPVCQGGFVVNIAFVRPPEEKAVVIALIIAIAPPLPVPASLTANDCFGWR